MPISAGHEVVGAFDLETTGGLPRGCSASQLPRFFLMNTIPSRASASAIARYPLFQGSDLLVGIAALELSLQGQANNAGAKDEEVGVHVRWRTSD